MAVRYSSGKHNWYICDRCGQRYPYQTRKKEWTGSLTGHDCWEPKHEQLTPPKNVHDAWGLRDARPDREDFATHGDPAVTGGLQTPLSTPTVVPINQTFLYPDRFGGTQDLPQTKPWTVGISAGLDVVLQMAAAPGSPLPPDPFTTEFTSEFGAGD